MFCGIVALLVHTHFTFHLYILSNLIALGALSGIWYLLTAYYLENARKNITLTRKSKALLCFVSVLFCVFGLHGASQLSVTERLYEKGEKAWARDGDINSFVNYNNLASLYSFGQDPNAFLNIAKMQTALIQNTQFSQSDQREIFESTLQLFEKAESLNPYDPTVFFNRGVFFETLPTGLVEDNQTKAITQWQKAYELNSRYEPVLEKLGKSLKQKPKPL